jgi:hypothetical protein
MLCVQLIGFVGSGFLESGSLHSTLCPHPTTASKKTYERSQEVIENKRDRFITDCESQEVYENKGVIFVKPRGC